jgi:hypothetical protein
LDGRPRELIVHEDDVSQYAVRTQLAPADGEVVGSRLACDGNIVLHCGIGVLGRAVAPGRCEIPLAVRSRDPFWEVSLVKRSKD